MNLSCVSNFVIGFSINFLGYILLSSFLQYYFYYRNGGKTADIKNWKIQSSQTGSLLTSLDRFKWWLPMLNKIKEDEDENDGYSNLSHFSSSSPSSLAPIPPPAHGNGDEEMKNNTDKDMLMDGTRAEAEPEPGKLKIGMDGDNYKKGKKSNNDKKKRNSNHYLLATINLSLASVFAGITYHLAIQSKSNFTSTTNNSNNAFKTTTSASSLLPVILCPQYSFPLLNYNLSQNFFFSLVFDFVSLLFSISLQCVFEYYWHRLMHTKFCMRHFHKLHHSYTSPEPFDDLYIHPVEAFGYYLILIVNFS